MGTAAQTSSSIGDIYAHAAAQDLRDRNPIVFIPGVMGSKLVDTRSAQSVWGDFSRAYADPSQGDNRRLIALPMEMGVPLDRLESPTEADGAVGVARPRRIPLAVGAYRDIMQSMGVATGQPAAKHRPVYGTSGTFASFEFGYDWRRSLDETACQLAEFLRLATFFVQAVRGNSEPVKFDIVAHSMGGLVLRYFLRHGAQLLPLDGSLPRLTWAGSELVSRAIIIGTPSAGATVAIERLVEGLPTKHLVHPGFDPFIVGTMPALYQLLPRTRHKPFVQEKQGAPTDFFDPEFWTAMRWGLAGESGAELLALQLDHLDSPAKRKETALDHLAKCLRQASFLHASLDRPASPPSPLELHLLAGDAHPTLEQVTGEVGVPRVAPVRYGAGDGTVLRSSALLDERQGGKWRPGIETPIPWSSVVFSTSNHMALTKDRVVIDNALLRLFEFPKDKGFGTWTG